MTVRLKEFKMHAVPIRDDLNCGLDGVITFR